MPAPAIRQVLRRAGVAVGATVAADVAALLARARVETWGPWFGLLGGLLVLTGLLALGAAVVLALAWSRSRSYVMDRTQSPSQEADALDDIADGGLA